MRKLSSTSEQLIVDSYKNGLSAMTIRRLVGCSATTCYNILERHGVTRRSGSECHRVHSADHSFFKTIDTEEKAYLLGFLATDGYVIKNLVGVTVAERDKSHLDKIRAVLRSTHRIHLVTPRGKHPIARFDVTSPELVADLLKHGIGERKTFTIKPWYGKYDLMRHYWRGCVDGDGSIYKATHKDKTIWTISFCGNKFMVQGFIDFIKHSVSYEAKMRTMERIYDVRYGGIELPRTIVQLLYENATIYLDRKMTLAQSLIRIQPIKPNRIGRPITFNGQTKRIYEWAKDLGIPFHTLYSRIQKGVPLHIALTVKGDIRIQRFTLNNNTHSIDEWASILGIKHTVIRNRLRRGWSVEKAFSPHHDRLCSQ